MKDPTKSPDPRLVSAYSVYKGLVPGLKTYQDTSQPTPTSQKKKAGKKNRKRESDDIKMALKAEEAKALLEEVGANGSSPQKKGIEKSNGAANGNAEGKKKDKTKRATEINEVASTTTITESTDEGSKRKKKRKKNKKRKDTTNEESQEQQKENSTSVLDSTVCMSDDDDAPPLKARKLTKDLVPNPLASSVGQKKKKRDSNQKADVNTSQSLGGAAADTSTSSPKKKSKKKKNKKGSQITDSRAGNRVADEFDGLEMEVPSTTTPAAGKSKVDKKQNKQKALALTSSKSTPKKSPYEVTSSAPPPEPRSVFNSKRIEDSVEHGKMALEWVIHPVSSEEFMKDYFEKKPLLIKRKHEDCANFYRGILTTQLFDDILRRNCVKYTVNVDITSYTDGVRETLSENMQGRVRPAVVWDYYNNGCSIRMLNPQSFIQPLWRLNSSLQEWFGSFVGANMYLTPPDSQGFAPHYDDIDAFILQVEGKKQWKLYAPRKENEKLPRFSSGNFSEAKDKLGEPILDVVLEEGDLLYFPRGVIHQAKTVDSEHSLHLTLSFNQVNTFGDLLKHHMNHALEKLMANDVSFRQGLPNDYMSFMGIAHENTTDKENAQKRKTFSKKIEQLVTKLAKEPADFAADAMGKKFIWDSLPPFLSSKERETCVVEDGEFMQEGRVFNRVEFGPEVEVKLLRKNCVRLVVEEGVLRLYYSTENSLVYHDEEAQFLELTVELAPAINHLISQYPNFTKIEDLPLSSDDISQKIQVISDLWERSLIFTKEPLEPCDVDEVDSDDMNDDEQDDDDDDIESVNLSDLPVENGEDGSDGSDESDDDFYDTSAYGLVDDSDDEDGEGSEEFSNDEVDDGQADQDGIVEFPESDDEEEEVDDVDKFFEMDEDDDSSVVED
ncbi:Bifunctional lysine-specific demethylase and histidyl-hydroxylase NO66 [Orchesella cincta]|uniref:Bifunctional lysine-specific demethylase and histidyl-hydroxylase n=1 Tax=Orchesella cincta TaxID=48709 RepID=A0A1D2N3X4_ORCCI|nr:Bifunctional lysine-specific demethylase and histidyl-hydroxylase NO66 [Orchesella cincta]